MKTRLTTFAKKLTALVYLLGLVSLIVGVLLSTIHLPASAAGMEETPTTEGTPPEGGACTPPADFDRTVRLKGYGTGPFTKEWTFEVDEPEMEVVLEFIYYQDYDKYGCPFDCSTGDCQDDEIGTGESPLGSIEVTDGKFGADGGSERLRGRLVRGSYQASFTAGGSSMNIGLKVHRRSVPTDTPEPPPTATALPPTATATVAPPTATATENILPPVPTATNTPGGPAAANPTATPTSTTQPFTPTGTANPPAGVVTATPTATEHVEPPIGTRTPRPPATLPPPLAPTQGGNPPSLIPETGADLAALDLSGLLGQRLFLKLGVALLGLGLLLHGLSRRMH